MAQHIKLCLTSERVWIDPPGRYEPSAILVEAGRITGVVPIEAAARLDPSWRVIDVGRQPVFPGLINTHVHLEFSASSRPLDEFMAESVEERLLRAIGNARQLLLSGVTTARDCGSSRELLVLARRPDLHPLALPRLIMSGAPITPRRGHLHMMGGEAESPEEIDAAIEASLGQGARSIKLMGSGGGMTPGTAPETVAYSQEMFDHVAKRARALGLPSVVHVLATESVRRAATARFDSLEHCAFFVRNGAGLLERRYDAVAAAMVRDSGAYVMANLSTATSTLAQQRAAAATDPLLDHQVRQFDLMIENFGRLHALGIPFVSGTDAGVRDTPFTRSADELVWMQRGGLSPLESIRTTSINAASALRQTSEIGRIASGLSADLIVLGDDPLTDLGHFHSPLWVIAQGEIVRAPGPHPTTETL